MLPRATPSHIANLSTKGALQVISKCATPAMISSNYSFENGITVKAHDSNDDKAASSSKDEKITKEAGDDSMNADHSSRHHGNIASLVSDLATSDDANGFSLSAFSAPLLFEASSENVNNDCSYFPIEKEQQQKEDEEGGNSSFLKDASSTLITGLESADDGKSKSRKSLALT